MGILIMINTALLMWLLAYCLAWHCSNRIPTGQGLRWGIRWGLAATLFASFIGGLRSNLGEARVQRHMRTPNTKRIWLGSPPSCRTMAAVPKKLRSNETPA